MKLYILYAALGFYTLYYAFFAWVFPFDNGLLQIETGLAASAILYFIAPAICLYQPRIAPVLGLICLAGLSPFGIHWLQFRLYNEYFIVWKPENILMYVAVAWYLVTVMVTINAYTTRHHQHVKYYSRKTKFILSIVPLIIFIAAVCLGL